MQLLAGRFKGRRIRTSTKIPYRPTLSRIRKSIFDILSPFNYSDVLDLFSGTGILGFEAASRGANTITFVEQNRKSIQLLQSNADQFPDINFIIKQEDVYTFLKNSQSYDLIIADPPYNHFNRNTGIDVDLFIDMILDKLNLQGRFIFECSKRIDLCYPVKTRVFGETKISMGRKE